MNRKCIGKILFFILLALSFFGMCHDSKAQYSANPVGNDEQWVQAGFDGNIQPIYFSRHVAGTNVNVPAGWFIKKFKFIPVSNAGNPSGNLYIYGCGIDETFGGLVIGQLYTCSGTNLSNSGGTLWGNSNDDYREWTVNFYVLASPILAQTFQLTVNNGTGSGSYPEYTAVDISATVPQGKHFVAWTGDIEYLISDPSVNPNVFVSQSSSKTITATFADNPSTYHLTVINGTGSGDYVAGTLVNISPSVPDGNHFTAWSDPMHLHSAVTVGNNILTMPSGDYTISAMYSPGAESGLTYHVWVDNFSELNSIVTVPIVNKLSDIQADTAAIRLNTESIIFSLSEILSELKATGGNIPNAVIPPDVPQLRMNVPEVDQDDLSGDAFKLEKINQIEKLKVTLTKLKDSIAPGGGIPPPIVLHMTDNVVQDSFFIDFGNGFLKDLRLGLRDVLNFVCALGSLAILFKVIWWGIATI